jgi:hypothetical protein
MIHAVRRRPARCATIAIVPWRRFLLFAAVLILLTSLVSAVGTQQGRRTLERRPPPTLPEPPPSTSAAVVTAKMPRKAAVRARVGDVVRLTVRSRFSDTVALPGLAIEGPVDQGAPAQLVFVADQAGRFPVVLRDAGQPVGTLVVKA